MTAPVVHVPGKVMLSGEYAVMHGGTAALAPVDRWLTVREGQAVETPSPVVEEALKQKIPALAGFEADDPLTSVVIDRAEFQAAGPEGEVRKLGIGSSAAEAVGIIALRHERAGLLWKERRREVASLAADAHSRAQGGKGSGADVWACAMGGPITYRLSLSGVDAVPIQPLEGTPALTLAWTGVPASTRALVDIFEGWIQSDPLADGPLARLADAADVLAPLWFCARSEELYDAFDEFVARMDECAIMARLPWRVNEQEELEEWAVEHGGRAKPTGAGGGDLTLLVGDLPWHELNDVPLLHLAPDLNAD
ncbi:MAG: hypothetical protein V2A56_12090 [bacterium]